MARKTKKEIDINNTEAILEDMKKIALEKQQEKEVVKKDDKDEIKETVVEEENCEDIVKTKEENPTIIGDASEDMIKEKGIEDVEKNEEIKDEETTENTEDSVKDEPKTEETKSEEDLSFIDEVKNTTEEDKKDIYDKKPKRKHKTYEQMFGYSWMGYGISE